MDSANLCGFILQLADSAYNLQNPHTICGHRLQTANSDYSCGFHISLNLLKTYLGSIICLWVSQIAPNSANFVADSTSFVADSAKLPVFEAI